MSHQEPIRIYISHSNSSKDVSLLDKLDKHLSILERVDGVKLWHIGMVEAGSEKNAVIQQALDNSQIILLLISSDYITSDHCYDFELKQALEKHLAKKCFVLPVVIRGCDWEGIGLEKLTLVPQNEEPVDSAAWKAEDLPYIEVSKHLRKLIKKFKAGESLFGVSGNSKQQYIDLVKHADQHFTEGKYEIALEHYQKALNLYGRGYEPDKDQLEAQIKTCESMVTTSSPLQSKEEAPSHQTKSTGLDIPLTPGTELIKNNGELLIQMPLRKVRRWFGLGLLGALFGAIGGLVLSIIGLSMYGLEEGGILGMVFLVVGLILLAIPVYFITYRFKNKFIIRVNQNQLFLESGPMYVPFSGEDKVIPVNEIEQLYCKKFSDTTVNHEPVYDYLVNVITKFGDEVRLIRIDNARQAFYLEQEIEKFLGIEE